MNFSIIFLTRNRIQLLEGWFQSLLETTKNKHLIEIFPLCDEDDVATIGKIGEFETRFRDINVKFIVHKRSEWMFKDYMNPCVTTRCQGKYILAANDDCLMKTKNWDEIACMKLDVYLKDKPDGIVYGKTDDLTFGKPAGGEFTSFPIVSKAATDALGFIHDPEFKCWNADISTWMLFDNIQRICNLPEVKIEHLSYHANKRPKDEINNSVKNQSNTNLGPHTFVPRDSEVLLKKIESFKKQVVKA